MNRAIDLFEYETLASEYLSPMALDYYASGAGEEMTLGKNRVAFEAIDIRPRVLVDVSRRNLTTRVLGSRLGNAGGDRADGISMSGESPWGTGNR